MALKRSGLEFVTVKMSLKAHVLMLKHLHTCFFLVQVSKKLQDSATLTSKY